jgi:hypothetical protein
MSKAFPTMEENTHYILRRIKEEMGSEGLERLMADVLGRDEIIRFAEELALQKKPNSQPAKPKRRTHKRDDDR